MQTDEEDDDEAAVRRRVQEDTQVPVIDSQHLFEIILALVSRERDSRIVKLADTKPATISIFMPMLSLLAHNSRSARVDEQAESSLLMHHCAELGNLISSLEIDSSMPQQAPSAQLDVYSTNDAAQILDCIGNLERLRQTAIGHQETHPENVVLADIIELVAHFMRLPSDTPQMKFASYLERLLGEC